MMYTASRFRIPVTTERRSIEWSPARGDAFSVFRLLGQRLGMERVFLLDSVTDPRVKHRLAIVAADPVLEVRFKGDGLRISGEEDLVRTVRGRLEERSLLKHARMAGPVSEVLGEISAAFETDSELPPFGGGFIGYVGYDAVRYFERIPHTTRDDRGLDDMRFQIHRWVLHIEDGRLNVFAHGFGDRDPEAERVVKWLTDGPLPAPMSGGTSPALHVMEDVGQEEFVRRVRRAKEYIRDGDIFQVVLSKRMRVRSGADPLWVYDRLRGLNPSPYMFYVDYGDVRLFGASPEAQLRVEGGTAHMRPIAGTSKGKGRSREENLRLVEALKNDEKERAEHLMLVDLCRNDLGRICRAGTVKVDQLMVIEEYSHVFHLVSHVRGELRENVKPLEAVLATFPAGTLSGAPKVRAMEIIDELEEFDRGPYGGAVGCIDWKGQINLAIMIRTVVHQGETFYLQAGAGIVADSDPEMEWLECGHKLAALRSALFPGDPL
ncbi:MAG: anthranilate synthase component I family protein [Alicyclobacillaceae bacterium]|nr:anthranilate synthase component I family protein [Alicyclobacillaceae bacterium]